MQHGKEHSVDVVLPQPPDNATCTIMKEAQQEVETRSIPGLRLGRLLATLFYAFPEYTVEAPTWR